MTTPLTLTEEAMAHWLPWWWVGDGALVTHDGGIAIGWELTGVDVTCEPDDRLNAITYALRRFLNAIPPGLHLQVLRHCTTVPSSYFDGYLSAQTTSHPLLREQRQRNADDLRARALRRYETFVVLTHPRALGRLGAHQRGLAPRLFDAMFGMRDPAKVSREQHRTALEALRSQGDTLADHLKTTGVALSKLGDEALVHLAYSLLNPTRALTMRPAIADRVPERIEADGSVVYRPLSLREQLLHSDVRWDVDVLWLDDPFRPFRMMGLRSLPRVTLATQMKALDRIEFEHWLSVGIGVPDAEKKFATIERRRNRAQAMAGGEVRNVRADAQFRELEAALNAMTTRDQRLFNLTLHVLFGAADLRELDDRTREVAGAFQELGGGGVGTVVQTETTGQLHAFLGVQPAGAHTAPHSKLVFTDTAADFLPVYSSSPGDARPLFVVQTRTGEPYAIDIANRGRTNWNKFILGQTGGGKTFLALGLLTSTMAGLDSPVMVIDVGGREEGSYYRLTQLLGGDFVDLGLDGRYCINPFFSRKDLYVDDDTGLPSTKPSATKTLFLTKIATLLVTDPGEKPLTTVQARLIERAILAAYDRLGESRPPVFGDVVAELDAMNLERDDKADAKRFAKTMRAWIEGSYGQLLNQQSRVDIRSSFVVFDLKNLEGVGRLADIVILIISAFVWNIIARKRDGRLAWIVYDECWKQLQNDSAAELQRELYKTARKLNTGVVSITQELADFLAAPAARAIVANSSTTFLLPHRDGHDQVADLLNLNERERALFKGSATIPGLQVVKGLYSEFLYRTAGPPARSAVLRNVPGPADYWVNTTDAQDKELERRVLAEMGGDRLATLRRLMRDFPNGSHQPARRTHHA
jgi:hypothetical protein